MTRHRLASFLRALADRLDPPEREPEVMSCADFCERLRLEREAEEIEADIGLRNYARKLRRMKDATR